MNILFVCSGNICRSPFAAAWLRHQLAAKASSLGFPEIQVQSAGTSAAVAQPMSLAMELILEEKGIDSQHQSQRLHWELVEGADLILTMTRAQKYLLLSQVPELADKLATLNEYVGITDRPDIDDPYGTDLESYRQCAGEIEQACARLLAQLHRPAEADGHIPGGSS